MTTTRLWRRRRSMLLRTSLRERRSASPRKRRRECGTLSRQPEPHMTIEHATIDARLTCISCLSCAVSICSTMKFESVLTDITSPSSSLHVCWRLLWHVQASNQLMRWGSRMQFADKTTLGQSAILGLLYVPPNLYAFALAH